MSSAVGHILRLSSRWVGGTTPNTFWAIVARAARKGGEAIVLLSQNAMSTKVQLADDLLHLVRYRHELQAELRKCNQQIADICQQLNGGGPTPSGATPQSPSSN